jgi:hypothetical protein
MFFFFTFFLEGYLNLMSMIMGLVGHRFYMLTRVGSGWIFQPFLIFFNLIIQH